MLVDYMLLVFSCNVVVDRCVHASHTVLTVTRADTAPDRPRCARRRTSDRTSVLGGGPPVLRAPDTGPANRRHTGHCTLTRSSLSHVTLHNSIKLNNKHYAVSGHHCSFYAYCFFSHSGVLQVLV